MKKSSILILLIVLSVMLLACIGSEIVRKGAEPIDKQGCKIDCKELEFYSYDYPTHTCKCEARDGTIVILYSWKGGDK